MLRRYLKIFVQEETILLWGNHCRNSSILKYLVGQHGRCLFDSQLISYLLGL